MLGSELAESQKTVGLSDEQTESEQHSDSAQSISPPPAASPDMRKRKRGDGEETFGVSKLAEPAAEDSSPDDEEAFDPFAMTGVLSSYVVLLFCLLLSSLLSSASFLFAAMLTELTRKRRRKTLKLACQLL
jgi:hypothetical protein